MKTSVWLGAGCVALSLLLCAGIGCQSGPRSTPSGDGKSETAKPSVAVAELRSEYLSHPMGIDVRQPRLSWQLAPAYPDARGLRQKAYHILVSSSPALLAQDQGDLWDSGEVRSDASVNVPYKGKPLTSRMQCHWKVRVRDQDGVLSSWSEPSSWTMGLLEAADWKAQWIGVPDEPPATQPSPTTRPSRRSAENTMPDPWFRKTFMLAEKSGRAAISIASVGYHELYVNGQKIGDAVLAPSATDHTQRARYVTYDITDHLHKGQNAIGLWLGVSWSIYPSYKTSDKPQKPLVIAQADIDLSGGQTMQVVTDATWKTHPSPNQLLGVWNFMNFGGELYDANREVEGWCKAEFADADWKAAEVFKPSLVLSAEMVEPNKCLKEIRPVAIEMTSSGDYRVDMGVNFAGLVEIKLAGSPGKRIDFQFSEAADKAMTHQLRSAYVLGPSGKGTFRNRFNYSVGRWITIKGLEAKPAPEDIRGYLVRTDFQRAGQFECSNKLFNDIYNATLWTFENLTLGGYVVDCPHRERMGYGGDAHATIDVALDNYQLGAFYTKWSQDWRDVQGKEASWGLGNKAVANQNVQAGNLPYTAPTYWGGGGPGWSGICITLPWHVYRHCGDVRILEENFPTMQRWLAFLESKSSNDMLVRWGGEWDFLGDWLWPGAKGVNGDTRETLFFNNCYWIYNLQTAARIADLLGQHEAASHYRLRAEAVRRAVHQTFFNPADHSYVNGFQAYLAIALLVDLPPKELRPMVWERLEDEILIRRNGHIHAGITGGAFVLKALLENHRDDLIFAMASKEDYPGWGDMLKRGATTLWESWEGDNSLLHSSYLYIGAWFNEGLGGIQLDPEVAGYKSFVIRPGAMAGRGVDWAKARYESPYGTIVSEWKVESGKLQVHVRVPPNTSAKLLLPTRDPRTVLESGRPVARAAGVKRIGHDRQHLVLKLEAGEYAFEAKL